MTKPSLPGFGLGTAALALTSEHSAHATIDTAVAAGLRYFDTAPLYGGGLAEERLGIALKSAPADVIVSTKCGRMRDRGASPSARASSDYWNFSENATRASIAQSCERLDRNHLDIVFLHDIEAAPEQAFAEALPTLRALQNEGVIGMVGAGCNTVEGLRLALEAGASDIALIAGRWTLLDRSAGSKLLPQASKIGTKIVCGGVLNSGLLADPMAPDAQFDYRPARPPERAAAQRLAAHANAEDVPLLAAALQFPNRDPRVTTTLLGAASSSELKQALSALATKIPAHFWNKISDEGIFA